MGLLFFIKFIGCIIYSLIESELDYSPRYKIYKNDYEEWIDNVKPENHIEISSEEFSRFVESTM